MTKSQIAGRILQVAKLSGTITSKGKAAVPQFKTIAKFVAGWGNIGPILAFILGVRSYGIAQQGQSQQDPACSNTDAVCHGGSHFLVQ